MEGVWWVVLAFGVLGAGVAISRGSDLRTLWRGGLAHLPTSDQTHALRGHETWRRLAADLGLHVERSSPLPPRLPGTLRAMNGRLDEFPIALWVDWSGRYTLHVQLSLEPPLPSPLVVRSRPRGAAAPSTLLTGDPDFDAVLEVAGGPPEEVLTLLGPEQRDALGRLLEAGRRLQVSADAVELVVEGEVIELKRLHAIVQQLMDAGAALRRARLSHGESGANGGEPWRC